MATTGYGGRLRDAREQAGLTQRQVAARYNAATGETIEGQAVSNWERGVSIPEVHRAVPLLGLLGVPEDEALMVWAWSWYHRSAGR